MRSRASQLLLLLRVSAWTAVALCALLLIEAVRSFHRSDRAAIGPMTFVTHRGSLYMLPNLDMPASGIKSEPVTRAPAWPVTQVPLSLKAWNDMSAFGFTGWSDGVFFVVRCPIWFALLSMAVLAISCRRGQARIIPRTHYLECPSCGYLLLGVVQWRCPECGERTNSRIIEALPPRPRPAHHGDAQAKPAIVS